MDALTKEVGGSHYMGGYQPVELFAKLSLNGFQSNVAKYVTRHLKKNGLEDIKKALHYVELAIQLKPFALSTLMPKEYVEKEVFQFASTNILGEHEHLAIYYICIGEYDHCIEELNMLAEWYG